jgi:hypothetical protein
MAQLVFEFGAENIDGVKDAIEIAVGNNEYLVSITTATEVESLEYIDTHDDLKSATEKIEEGTFTSFVLSPKDSPISWAMLNAPYFLGDAMPLWYGAIEYKELEWEILFNHFLEVEELQFLSISMEECLELKAEDLKPETFPWDHWRLITGAVRNHSSTTNNWVLKKGPAWDQIK